MKKVWCRKERTVLGFSKPKEKRWRCPDCKKRFKICSDRVHDGDILFFVSAHKKEAK
jgi:hypothetical protein